MPTYLVIGANTMNCDSTTNSASASGQELEPQGLKFRVANVTLLNGQNTVRGFSLATLAAALAACGGGGSGGPTPPPPPPPPPPPNNAPTATDASGTAVEDGDPATGSAVGSDEDGDALTYSVTKDGDLGSLALADDGSWTYTITDSDDIQALGVGATLTDTATIEVSDGEATASATVTITIEGANDDPTGTDGTGAVTAGMDMAAMGDVGAADVDAGDTHTFAVGDAPAHGTLTVDEAGNWNYVLNQEDPAVMALDADETVDDSGTIVISDNNGGSATVTITVTITGVNDAPGAPTVDASADGLTVKENDDSGQNLGTVSATDPEGDAVTYSVDNDHFEVETVGGTALLKVKDGMGLDYEATEDGTITLMVTATDAHGNASEATSVTVTVTNVNEMPTLTISEDSALAIGENMTGAVAMVMASDPEQTIGADDISVDDERFDVVADEDGNLLLSVVADGGIDADTEESVTVELEVIDDGGLAVRTEAVVSIVGENEVPTVMVQDATTPDGKSARALVSENTSVSVAVGQIVLTDQEETLDASNVTLSDDRFSTMTDAQGGIWLMLDEAVDYETDGDTVSVTVTVTDTQGLTADTTVNVAVVNVNEAPTITAVDGETTDGIPATSSILEHVGDGEFAPVPVAAVTVSDPEQAITADDISVSDSRFSIMTDALGGLWLMLDEGLDAEAEEGPEVMVTLTATDSSGLTAEAVVTVTVGNVNEAPTISLTPDGVTAVLEQDENASGRIAQITATDPEDALTADNIVLSGDDSANFSVETDVVGGLWLAIDEVNYEEVGATQSVTLTVTDMDGVEAVTIATVNINDVNDPPMPTTDGGLGVIVINKAATDDKPQEDETLVNLFARRARASSR